MRGVLPRAVKVYIHRKMAPVSEELGITPGSAPFLSVIQMNPGISLKGLSENLMVDKALSTRMVKQLIEGGFVQDMDSDGKEYRLRATRKGDEALKVISSELDKIWSELFKYVTDEEREAFFCVTDKISRVVLEDFGKEAER